MGRMDIIGDRMDIGGGNTEIQDSFGPSVTQMTGDMMSLSKTNRPIGQFTDQPMGSLEFTGDRMPLGRKPNRGYEAGTPCNSQSENPDTTESY